MAHAFVRPRRPAVRLVATVLVVLVVLVGCHASATRGRDRALRDGYAAVVARPDPGALFATPIDEAPVRATRVAMPGARTSTVLPSLALAGSWAEAPVAPQGDYEVHVGVGVGLSFPGDQDLKFKRKNVAGDLIDNLFSDDVAEHPGLSESIDVEVWKTRGFLADFGLRASLVHWTTRVEAKSFEDRLPGGTSPVPPFDTLDQDRLGVYVSLERRFSLARRGVPASESPYVHLGLGAGYVCSDVTHGATNWDTSALAYVGFTVPVADRWRLRVEGLFLATRDVDIEGGNLDWEAETSGSPTGLPRSHYYSHLDTRFFVATVGFEFRL